MSLWAAFVKPDSSDHTEPWRLAAVSALSAGQARSHAEREQARRAAHATHAGHAARYLVLQYESAEAVPYTLGAATRSSG